VCVYVCIKGGMGVTAQTDTYAQYIHK